MPHMTGKISPVLIGAGWCSILADDPQQFPDANGPLFPTTIADPAYPRPEEGRIPLENYLDRTTVELDFISYNPDNTGVGTGVGPAWWIMGVTNFRVYEPRDS